MASVTAARVLTYGLGASVDVRGSLIELDDDLHPSFILDSPWEARSMTIAELLTSQHRWGTARCNKFLSGVGISETKTVESMTERQRCLLARMVQPQAH